MKIAVLDDEKFYRDDVKTKIENYQKDHLDVTLKVDVFEDAEQFLKTFMDKTFDLVYLDIKLNEKNGMNIAQIIYNTKPSCMIIFITSYMEYFNESFTVHAFQYMKKPIETEFFNRELTRAIQEYQFNNKSFIFPTTQGNTVIEMGNIIYIETAYSDYKICGVDEYYYGRCKTVKKISKILLEYNFFRVQRSFIVNLAHIKSYDRESIIMSNGDIIPISRKKYKEFEKRFHKYISA